MHRLYALTVFTSALLLFMIQPMLAKMLLPKAGGAPAVWIVAMLFFQVMLLAGYAYAALGNAVLRPRTQALLHMVLLVVAIWLFLPMQMPAHFNLVDHAPEMVVLGALLACIGLPYFMLAAHNSMLQHWYFQRFGKPPYPLFAISNAGSFLGLLGYPLAVEWLLPLSQQTLWWSAGFALLMCMIAGLAICLPRQQQTPVVTTNTDEPIRHIGWIILSGFIPSSLFLSTTLYVTTDVASFPLLWVVPLALYLLSFIIAFAPSATRIVQLSHTLHPVAVTGIVISGFIHGNSWMLLLSFAFFFIIAISCHGYMARLKPAPSRLGLYYLYVSIGGALGGLVGVITPHLLNGAYEYYAVALLSLLIILRISSLSKLLIIGLVVTSYLSHSTSAGEQILHQSRNFFGIFRVSELKQTHLFRHGTTTHGIQSLKPDQRLRITSYYTPVEKLVKQLPAAIHTKPFGFVGLGAGTLACVGTANQNVDFFEIDPDVAAIARNPDYFTFLRDCPPHISIIIGDGRLTLAEQPDARYHLLVIDAFSSDAIPVHLLTTEAVQLYLQKLDPASGILGMHISNRHLHLEHLTAAAIRAAGWTPFLFLDKEEDEEAQTAKTKKDPLVYPSIWVFAVPPGSKHQPALIAMGASPYTADTTTPWTDDYSNVLDALLP